MDVGQRIIIKDMNHCWNACTGKIIGLEPPKTLPNSGMILVELDEGRQIYAKPNQMRKL